MSSTFFSFLKKFFVSLECAEVEIYELFFKLKSRLGYNLGQFKKKKIDSAGYKLLQLDSIMGPKKQANKKVGEEIAQEEV